MLATDSIHRLTSGSTPLRYFSDADVDRYLELQRAVRSVWRDTGSTRATSQQQETARRRWEPNCDERDYHNVKSAELGSRGFGDDAVVGGKRTRSTSAKETPASSGVVATAAASPLVRTSSTGLLSREDGSRGKPRRFGSAAGESTIASRNKIRPEPKFQRVVTSHVFSQMRKDSRLIARNPTRYLEAIVDGQQSSTSEDPGHPTHAFSSYLTSFTTKSASQSYQKALQNLQEKCRQARSRNLLLNLGCTSATGSNSPLIIPNRSSRASSAGFDTFLNNRGGSGGDSGVTGDSPLPPSSPFLPQDYSRGDVDHILQSYLDDMRAVNVDNIKEWVESPATLNELDLPFGLPSSGVLRIPTRNLEVISSQTSQEFLRSAIDEFFLLDAEYHGKLEELMGKITDNFRELEMAGWAARDSALLFHLMSMTTQSKSHQHFSSEKLCTEVATRLFSGCHAKDNIIAQKYRLKVKKALEEKLDSVIKHWLMDKDKLVKRINSAWDDIQKQEQKKEEWSKEKKVQQEKCQYWMDLLEKMRKENRRKIRSISALVEPLEEQMRRQKKVKEEQERSRRLEQKEILERFHRIRMENEEEEKRHREEIQVKLEKDRKLRNIQNRARVHLRRQEYHEKKENEKEAEKRREEERRQREELLERTKEPVKIDWNPWNVLSDTHASLVRSHEIQSLISLRDHEEEASRRFFQERYSFSAETLWKDTRVRLEAKLREAGLMGNSYARHVLLAMQPKEKPHLQSQIKFNDEQNEN